MSVISTADQPFVEIIFKLLIALTEQITIHTVRVFGSTQSVFEQTISHYGVEQSTFILPVGSIRRKKCNTRE